MLTAGDGDSGAIGATLLAEWDELLEACSVPQGCRLANGGEHRLQEVPKPF